MKMIFSIATLALATSSHSFADTLVECKDTSGLTSGLSVVITSNGQGKDRAALQNRQGIGAYTELGSIDVTEENPKPAMMGAGLTYKGENFKLTIYTDSPSEAGGWMVSDIYADVGNQVFNQSMLCLLPTN